MICGVPWSIKALIISWGFLAPGSVGSDGLPRRVACCGLAGLTPGARPTVIKLATASNRLTPLSLFAPCLESANHGVLGSCRNSTGIITETANAASLKSKDPSAWRH